MNFKCESNEAWHFSIWEPVIYAISFLMENVLYWFLSLFDIYIGCCWSSWPIKNSSTAKDETTISMEYTLHIFSNDQIETWNRIQFLESSGNVCFFLAQINKSHNAKHWNMNARGRRHIDFIYSFLCLSVQRTFLLSLFLVACKRLWNAQLKIANKQWSRKHRDGKNVYIKMN